MSICAEEAMRKIALYNGIYTRVARQIGSDPSHVRRVALGLRKSERITAALVAEVESIEAKPRVELKCVLACNNGEVFARIRGTNLITRIGRDAEAEKIFQPSPLVRKLGYRLDKEAAS